MPKMTYRSEDGQVSVASWKDPGEGWSIVCTEEGLKLSRNGRVFPPDFIPSPDAFPEILQSRKHEIRDAQWKIRRWKAVEEGKHPDAAWRIKGKCSLRDYQVWLLHEPHGFLDLSIGEIFEVFPFLQKLLSGKGASLALPLSFQRIGDLLFPEVDDPDNRKKRAADAHNRVESEFGRGTLKELSSHT